MLGLLAAGVVCALLASIDETAPRTRKQTWRRR